MSDFISMIRTLVITKGDELGDLERAKFLAVEAIKRVGTPDAVNTSTPSIEEPAASAEPELVLCPQCGDEVEDAFAHQSGCPLKDEEAKS